MINVNYLIWTLTNTKNQWGKIPLYFGGPVELETGFVLHESTDDEFGWVLTGSRHKIQQMAQEDVVKPVMLTAGYCMWDSFQLEREVRLNNWLVIDSPASRILATVTRKTLSVSFKLWLGLIM